MNNVPVLNFTAFISVTVVFGVQSTTAAKSNAMPNIVIIFADDPGYGDVSYYGATKITTLNIDRLASEGMKFTDAHSAASLCSPSRYGLLTGRALWRLHRKGNGYRLSPGEMTLAAFLKNSGYTTAAIGKWHLGYSKDWNRLPIIGPLEVGFDYHFGVPQNHNDSGDIRRKFKTAKADAKKLGHVTSGQWRDGKGYACEGGHRIPFIARWPGRIEPGTSAACTMTMTDLSNDPGELENVANEHPEIAKRLAAEFQKAEAAGRTRS